MKQAVLFIHGGGEGAYAEDGKLVASLRDGLGDADWHYDGFALHEDFAAKLSHISRIFFYHSRDDEIVPFAHLGMYAAKLPQATIHEFDNRGHQFNNDLSEVIEDIRSRDDN